MHSAVALLVDLDGSKSSEQDVSRFQQDDLWWMLSRAGCEQLLAPALLVTSSLIVSTNSFAMPPLPPPPQWFTTNRNGYAELPTKQPKQLVIPRLPVSYSHKDGQAPYP